MYVYNTCSLNVLCMKQSFISLSLSYKRISNRLVNIEIQIYVHTRFTNVTVLYDFYL